MTYEEMLEDALRVSYPNLVLNAKDQLKILLPHLQKTYPKSDLTSMMASLLLPMLFADGVFSPLEKKMVGELFNWTPSQVESFGYRYRPAMRTHLQDFCQKESTEIVVATGILLLSVAAVDHTLSKEEEELFRSLPFACSDDVNFTDMLQDAVNSDYNMLVVNSQNLLNELIPYLEAEYPQSDLTTMIATLLLPAIYADREYSRPEKMYLCNVFSWPNGEDTYFTSLYHSKMEEYLLAFCKQTPPEIARKVFQLVLYATAADEIITKDERAFLEKFRFLFDT